MRKTTAAVAVVSTAAVCVACSADDAHAVALSSVGNAMSYVAPAEYISGTNTVQPVATVGDGGVVSQNLSAAINQLDLPIEFYSTLVWLLNSAAVSLNPTPL